jgi:hypothetical protein
MCPDYIWQAGNGTTLCGNLDTHFSIEV